MQHRRAGAALVGLGLLAGGRNESGTAIVLRQVWYQLGGGEFVCQQTVPSAKTCTGVG